MHAGRLVSKQQLSRQGKRIPATGLAPIIPQAIQSPGKPLEEASRAPIEARLGHDFSRVRIHDDDAADAFARSFRANALVWGPHVIFRAGLFQPTQAAGQRLLLHELTHIAQGAGRDLKPGDNRLRLAQRHHPAETEARNLVRKIDSAPDRVRPCTAADPNALHADRPDEELQVIEDEGEEFPIEYEEAKKKNLEWWSRLGLEAIRPLGSIDPRKTPNAYANFAYRLLSLSHQSGIDKDILGIPVTPDGIFGPRAFILLLRVAEGARDNPEVAKKLSQTFLDPFLKPILDAPSIVVAQAKDVAVAEIFKAKFTVSWQVATANEELWNFWETSFELGQEMRAQVDELLFNKNPPEGGDDADRFAILRELYKTESLRGVASLFEAERPFIHFQDLERLAGIVMMPGARKWRVYLGLTKADIVDIAIENLALKAPDTPDAARLLGEIHAQAKPETPQAPTPKQPAKPHIAALGLVYFLPVRTQQQVEDAVRSRFYQKKLREEATEQASAEWLASFAQDVGKRLQGPADVQDYQTLIELLTEAGGAPVRDKAKLAVLVDRAEESLGLVMKLGSDAKASFLPWATIQAMRARAVVNAQNPLNFGVFEPPPDYPLNIIKNAFTARRRDDNSVELARTVSELTKDSDKGVGVGNAWNDWKYFTKETYGNLEPVLVVMGELDPNTTFWVKRYRDVIGKNEWVVKPMWMLGGNLPDVSQQLWDKVNAEAVIGLIDAALSILAAASIITGPLIALESATAAGAAALTTQQIAVNVTRALLKRAFWFVVSEYFAQKFLELDHSIATEKEKYSEEDRKLWGYFKIGLLVLGGTLLLRQAWKGLRAGSSAALQTALADLETEISKAELKTEGAAAGAAGRGLAQAEVAVAERSAVLTEKAASAEARGGAAAGEAAARDVSFADQVLIEGPQAGGYTSAIAKNSAGQVYVQLAGQPLRKFIATLRGQLGKLGAATSGATTAELDLLELRVAELERAIQSGAKTAADDAVQTELRQIMARLESVTAREGVESLPNAAAKSFLDWFRGPKAVPAQAELDKLLDEVWARLKGQNKPTIRANPALPGKTAGWFEAWVGKFGEISVAAKAQTKGQIANTVYHEAMHARLREIFPWLAETPGKTMSLKYTLFRHIDEILAYAYGGYGQLRHGNSLLDLVEGTMDAVLSPWMAYGSANTWKEALPGIARDAALLTAYFYWLIKLVEKARDVVDKARTGVGATQAAPQSP